MKTATIERYHVYGTSRYNMCARYNGYTIATMPDGAPDMKAQYLLFGML